MSEPRPGQAPGPDDDGAEVARWLARRRLAVVPLQDWGPFTDTLDWRLARCYWQDRGPTAFVGGDVPYAVNNDGRLAEDAARVYAHAHADTPGPLTALEIGSGSGMFARLFLRALKRQNPEVAARTTYVATDATEAMVRVLADGSLLADAAGPVQTLRVTAPALAELGGRRVHAVFANYLLDNLPATLIRRTPDHIDEIVFRSVVDERVDTRALTGLAPEEIRRRLDAGDAEVERTLAPHAPSLAVEWRAETRAVEDLPHGDLLAPAPAEGEQLSIHGTGTIAFLEQALALLEPGGFLLVADYAAAPGGLSRVESVAQHFGGSMAHAVDFEQIDRWGRTLRGWQAFAPTAASESIQVRLVCGQRHSAAIAPFLICFDGARWDLPAQLLRLASECLGNHRHETTRDLLLQALEARPRNWYALERAAMFLLRTDHDPEAALVAAAAGLDLHPFHPGLWNLRGDAHYERREWPEAEAAFRRAIEIDPRDIRGRLNLSYVLADAHRYPEALAALGEALGLDMAAEHREVLLARQQRILQQMSDRERERLLHQANRVREHLGDDGGSA